MEDAAARQFAAWGLAPETVEQAQLFPVADAHAIDPSYPHVPAVVVPYWTLDGAPLRLPSGVPFTRIRRLDKAPAASGFAKGKFAKYLQPPGTGVHAYLPPLADWQRIARDPGVPLIVTEGEAKALAAQQHGFDTIALGGVWSFNTPGGQLLDSLRAFAWSRRPTYIVFDSDAAENPQVVAAEARLVNDLQAQGGAHCRVIRLPAAEDGGKQGLDDFLRTAGPEALYRLLRTAPTIDQLDAKVVALNRALAWIEFEGQVYDVTQNQFIQKANLVKGSHWGSIKHVTMTRKGAQKSVSVAEEWLTHPWARRYGECLFRPGEGEICRNEMGCEALNMWRPIPEEPGDVTPFLELTRHIFSKLPAEHRDLPLKLMAYKAQHPAEKVPLALVLIGTQGSGKTLWGELIRDSFGLYGKDVTPQQLASEFQGWVESSLVALVNEADGEDILKASETLKTLISDIRRPMNEKFRPVRQVNTYTSYIITSNRRAVGSFAADDRRMIVVNVPPKREDAFYDRLSTFKKAGGARKVQHFLRTLDLKGWTPPRTAPMTAEKYIAYVEGLTLIERLAADMRTADHNAVLAWLDTAMAWADAADGPQASFATAVRSNVNNAQVRPWYTPEELALMFPAIVADTLGGKWRQTTTPGEISRQLRDAGVPYLECADDPRGFRWRGQVRQFLVVAQFDEWVHPISQAEFDHRMAAWPTYAQLRRAAGRNYRRSA